MTKTAVTKIFTDEIDSKPPKTNYPLNKITYNHIDDICSTALVDFSDYKISNNKGYGYNFVIIDNFSKHTWCIPLKIKFAQTICDDFSNILTKTKRRPVKIESDIAVEF